MPTVNTRIPNRERLIFALDVAGLEEARALISRLGDSVGFYKLGLEVFLSGHYFELMAELKGKGKKIFAEFKTVRYSGNRGCCGPATGASRCGFLHRARQRRHAQSRC